MTYEILKKYFSDIKKEKYSGKKEILFSIPLGDKRIEFFSTFAHLIKKKETEGVDISEELYNILIEMFPDEVEVADFLASFEDSFFAGAQYKPAINNKVLELIYHEASLDNFQPQTP
jgi:hypothetical protein